MATVLILDPDSEMRELFALVIARLGHAATFSIPEVGQVDAVIVEPASPDALSAAETVRAAQPEIPVLCASVLPRDARTQHLAPRTYLLKPFSISRLERAVSEALA